MGSCFIEWPDCADSPQANKRYPRSKTQNTASMLLLKGAKAPCRSAPRRKTRACGTSNCRSITWAIEQLVGLNRQFRTLRERGMTLLANQQRIGRQMAAAEFPQQ
jgi:hypothetical protein